MLICGAFTNFIALPILTENLKWDLPLMFGMLGQQVIITILIIMATYYVLIVDLVLLTFTIFVICRFGWFSVTRKGGNTFRYMMPKVIIIGSFIPELVTMPIGTTFVGKILWSV